MSRCPRAQVGQVRPRLLKVLVVPKGDRAVREQGLPMGLLCLLPRPFEIHFRLDHVKLVRAVYVKDGRAVRDLFVMANELRLRPPMGVMARVVRTPSRVGPSVSPYRRLRFPTRGGSPTFLLPTFGGEVGGRPWGSCSRRHLLRKGERGEDCDKRHHQRPQVSVANVPFNRSKGGATGCGTRGGRYGCCVSRGERGFYFRKYGTAVFLPFSSASSAGLLFFGRRRHE